MGDVLWQDARKLAQPGGETGKSSGHNVAEKIEPAAAGEQLRCLLWYDRRLQSAVALHSAAHKPCM